MLGCLLFATACAGLPNRSPRTTAGASDGDSGWTHDIGAYLWLPAIDADSTVDGGTVSLDLDQGDLIDLLQFAASGRYEAWNGRRGYIVDLQWIDLGADFTAPVPPVIPAPGKIDIDIQQGTLDLMVARRLNGRGLSPVAMAGLGEDPDPTVDVFGGIRIVYFKQEIDPAAMSTLGGSETWVEPVIGGRVIVHASEQWSWIMRGDASGFGVGSASDLTWNLLLGGAYQTSEDRSLRFGYKWFGMDYSKGSGAETFGFDGTMQGPYFAYVFHF